MAFLGQGKIRARAGPDCRAKGQDLTGTGQDQGLTAGPGLQGQGLTGAGQDQGLTAGPGLQGPPSWLVTEAQTAGTEAPATALQGIAGGNFS